VVGGACTALRHGRGPGTLSGPLMSCGAKDGCAAVRACGAAGFRGQSRTVRSDDAGSRRGLHGLAVRVEPAGWRQDPRHLHP
jgi:hypothetical protein